MSVLPAAPPQAAPKVLLDPLLQALYASAMKVSILYHPESEFAHMVEEYVHDFEHQKGMVIELISLETKEGANLAELYDIVEYPALVVRTDTGLLLKHWQGEPLPLMNEVAGYLT
jgi:hypothetical protein